jgi:methylthioribose-1-phosphate isomerase
VVAAFGVAIEARRSKEDDARALRAKVNDWGTFMISARPTAVNLAWATRRVVAAASRGRSASEIKERAIKEAEAIMKEEHDMNERIGRFGSSLIRDGDTILTHCNAGSLATVDLGTALAPVRVAIAQGKKVSVYATETRPALQGARLTTFELMEDHIDVTLICDTMVGATMARGLVDKVFLGARDTKRVTG